MAESKKKYRSFHGKVKFPPREGEALGQNIRSIVFRNVGVQEQAIDVRATLWESHEDVEVNEGDWVSVEGELKVNKKDGETYFNVNVSDILVHGSGQRGVRAETANVGSSASDDDEEAY